MWTSRIGCEIEFAVVLIVRLFTFNLQGLDLGPSAFRRFAFELQAYEDRIPWAGRLPIESLSLRQPPITPVAPCSATASTTWHPLPVRGSATANWISAAKVKMDRILRMHYVVPRTPGIPKSNSLSSETLDVKQLIGFHAELEIFVACRRQRALPTSSD